MSEVVTNESVAAEAGEGEGQVADNASPAVQTEVTDNADGATEGQPSTDKVDDAGDGQSDTKDAPEQYELQAPEGMQLDDGLMKEFDPVFRDLGLDNEQAQKLADKMPFVYQRMAELQTKAQEDQVSSWIEEAKTDDLVGGEKFKENAAVANLAIKEFGDESLNELLDATGLGNHPALIRFAYRASVGASLSNGSSVTGNSSSAEKSRAEILYPNTN